ncbi:MAG: hypothetical protein ACP5I4_14575 [Oceanipulchritudo sp.]
METITSSETDPNLAIKLDMPPPRRDHFSTAPSELGVFYELFTGFLESRPFLALTNVRALHLGFRSGDGTIDQHLHPFIFPKDQRQCCETNSVTGCQSLVAATGKSAIRPGYESWQECVEAFSVLPADLNHPLDGCFVAGFIEKDGVVAMICPFQIDSDRSPHAKFSMVNP